MEVVSFGGWNCARFISGEVEILVTLDVGPRVISLRIGDEPNELYVKPATLGLKGGADYRGYGGHRLWIAPEIPEFTYMAENEPVEVIGSQFWSAPSPFGIQKGMEIVPDKPGSFAIHHFVKNTSNSVQSWAAWAITVMAPGGTCIVPQEPFVPHGEALLPARPIVLWPYAKMNDPRFEWGEDLIRLKQTADSNPTKFGALIKAGIAHYSHGNRLFTKRFPFDPRAHYPDYGVNFESFTRHDMLEVESLGPMLEIQPNETVTHTEIWTLQNAGAMPENEEECRNWLNTAVK